MTTAPFEPIPAETPKRTILPWILLACWALWLGFLVVLSRSEWSRAKPALPQVEVPVREPVERPAR